jgi:hypothetical protein
VALWAVAALAVALEPPAGLAHAVLVRSVPARRAALVQSPPRVLLWFNERLEPAYSSVSVLDAGGRRVDRGDGGVGPDDPKLLSATLPTLPPGRYVIRFRVLSVDGHVVESEIPFTVTGGTPRR